MVFLDLDIIFSYWTERYEDAWEEMTERERDLVINQMDKLRRRIEKLLGYEPTV